MTAPLTAWLERFRACANSNTEFRTGSEWLDLRLLLRIGEASCWFKLYRGQLIDAMPYGTATNRLGYQVIVSGPAPVWGRIADGGSSFGRENAMGALTLDGQRADGDMAYRALVALGDQVLRECGLPPQSI